MGFIKDRIENFKQKRMFTAQNCINHQIELKQREERRQIEEENRNYEALIDEIKNRISFVIGQSYEQQTVIFQVDEQQRKLFEKARDYFLSAGFNAFFQKMEKLPVEALVISWM